MGPGLLSEWATFLVALFAIVGAVIGAVKWTVTTVINGRLDRIDTRLDTHLEDHRALIGSLRRQGIEPPDGWTTVTRWDTGDIEGIG